MKKRILSIVALTCSLAGVCLAQSSPAAATTTRANGASSASYNEGPVWTVSMIKTKTGLNDEYIKQITGTVKPVYDEAKKQKIILDYKILNGEASDRNDFNMLILVAFPNYAAFDHFRENMDPITEKVMGSAEQRKDMAVKRLDIREIIGTKTMREITLR
jgi:hypothetical protein